MVPRYVPLMLAACFILVLLCTSTTLTCCTGLILPILIQISDYLIVYVQQATMDYGHLAQASGSILKEKSAWYTLWTTYMSAGRQD